MRWVSPRTLRRNGVLGMNSRNVEYISRYNPRRCYPVVDNKLNTKQAALAAGVAVPDLIGVIENNWELDKLAELVNGCESFVIKPARGSGGRGILVISGREFGYFIKSSGKKLELRELRRHVNNILSGLYSLGGKPDTAMIETMVEYSDIFSDYTYEGVPDLRIILFKGFPVMAMLRCSTHGSDGRANLHQGAVGVGLDIKTGNSLFAVQHNRPIELHPDTHHAFDDLAIPDWQQILSLASGCYEMTGLGYLGCDIVLDKHRGPMILEVNARPGLAIQIANGMGLHHRLKRIEKLPAEALELNAEARVEYLLAGELDDEAIV